VTAAGSSARSVDVSERLGRATRVGDAQFARRFQGGVDPARPFLSRLSQPEQVGRYAAVCLGLSTVFYLALGQALPRIGWRALPLVMVVHLAVNFHHYLVDAVIWRARRPRSPPSSPRRRSRFRTPTTHP
jgi:hypothetical protein